MPPSGQAGVVGSSLTIEAVGSFWKSFDLDGRRAKLDEVGLQIADFQEQSMASRRKLADATREFRRSQQQTPPQPAAAPGGGSGGGGGGGLAGAQAGPLIKAYQEGIDQLTRRAKHSESAFLALYEALYEAPDPAPALAGGSAAEARISELEGLSRRLEAELAEYKAESKAIKNQDLTIRKQEEAIRELTATLEAKETELQQAQQLAAAEADAALVERIQAREAELTEMLAGAQASLAAMQRLYGAAQQQLFDLQSKREEDDAGRQVAMELAGAELERAQERLAALEAERAALKGAGLPGRRGGGGGEAAHGGGGGRDLGVEDQLRAELAAQHKAAARLRSDLAAARAALAEAEAMAEEAQEAAQEALAAAQARAADAERQLAAAPTTAHVEELRQQVRILQAVGGYSLGEGDAAPGGALTLEGMLVLKNRRLEHEVTMARLSLAEQGQQLEAAQGQVAELEGMLASRNALVRQLEEDVLSSRGAGGPQLLGSSGELLRRSGGGGGGGDGEADGAGSMMRVLLGQRERLRARVRELEEALAAARAELQAAQTDMAAARADNVALVERLRYVGGYRQQSASRKVVGSSGGSGPDVEAGGAGADVLGKYENLYEQSINPFKDFQGQQREQKRKQMNVADKSMYAVGHLVYRNAAARLVAFVYLCAMHMLVFASLSRWTHHNSSRILDHHQTMLDQRHDLTQMMHSDSHPPGSPKLFLL